MLLIYITSVLTWATAAASEFTVFTSNGSVSEPLRSSAVLPCGLSPSTNAVPFEIRWYRNDHNNPVLLYKDLQIQESPVDPQYKGRVSLTGDLEKGNTSLKLEKLTLADRGDYVCLVKSISWYESAKVNLIVKVLGSSPLLALAEVGGQVNVSCVTDGWSPKPTLTWRDKGGRELICSHIYYKTDSEGLVSVSSWLLVSPSESEWISCSVGVSDQEMKEARVVPFKESWKEAFIITLIISLITILLLLTALLLFKKGLLPCWLSSKNTTTAEEALLLTGSQPSAEERLKLWNNLKKNKEKLTVDPDTRHRNLIITQDGTGVHRGDLKVYELTQPDPFPPALSKEEFSSGLKYWEVKVDQRERSKKSWCVGVTQKPPTKETLTALCYKEDCGIYTSSDPRTEVSAEDQVTTLGLLLDFKHSLLSFYNVDPPSHLYTFTMENMENRTYCALISPGIKDTEPVSFHR